MTITLRVTTPLETREQSFEVKGLDVADMLQPILNKYTQMVVDATIKMKDEKRVGDVKGEITYDL